MPSTTSTPLTLTHIGGPTVLIEYAGLRIVSDPAFDPAGSKYKVSGLLPLKKTTDPAIRFDKIGTVDAVLVSHHHHADNFDKAGRKLAKTVLGQENGAVFTTPQGAKTLTGATGLNTWQSAEIDAPAGTVTITAAPAKHAHGIVAPIAGPVTGFILSSPALPTLYISGDNISAKATAQVAERFNVDVAILHAGAPKFTATGPIAFCMTAKQVANAVETLGKPNTLVVHSDGWNHFSETAADVVAAFERSPVAKARIVAPLGKAVTLK